MRISDWSSDVCSSDLEGLRARQRAEQRQSIVGARDLQAHGASMRELECVAEQVGEDLRELGRVRVKLCWQIGCDVDREFEATVARHAPETAFAVVGEAAQRHVFPAVVHTTGFALTPLETDLEQSQTLLSYVCTHL